MTQDLRQPLPACPEHLLATVLLHLPLHAEEDAERDKIDERHLIAALVAAGTTEETAHTLVYSVRRQFEALALLDPMVLLDGAWAFVSYPASLLARSWLTTLATPGHRLVSADYWEQGDAKPAILKEEQRSLLRRVETGRVQFNPEAMPIRVVHVAWGFIRIGDQFLLHRREDIARPGEKSHVLPGGRFKLSDLPLMVRDRPGILAEVFDAGSQVVAQWIHLALERELSEELNLAAKKHYTSTQLGAPLPIYREVNGAGNRHAYTAYRFFLYQVNLTTSGETHLMHQVASSNELTWLSATELAAGQRADGPSAYIDALRQAWGEQLEVRLEQIPDSRQEPYVFALAPGPKGKGQSNFIYLPADATASLRFGKPGHEHAFDIRLNEEEWSLLMLLGWHARGFPVRLNGADKLRLLLTGWVDVADSLAAVAQGLVAKVAGRGCPAPGLLEIRDGRFVGMRAAPAILFFAPGLFRYSIDGTSGNKEGGLFQFERRELRTPWGLLEGDSYCRSINRNIVCILRDLEQGSDPERAGVNAIDWPANLRQQLLADVNRLGMSTPWTTAKGKTGLVLGLTKIEVDRV